MKFSLYQIKTILGRAWSNLSLLGKCMVFSLVVHMALLSLKIASPKTFDRLFNNDNLDVVLVNAFTEHMPQNAKALAQANFDGGGELDEGMSSSAVLLDESSKINDATQGNNVQDSGISKVEKKIDKNRQKLILLQQKTQAMLAQLENDHSEKAQLAKQQLLSTLGKIDKALELDSSRPRRGYIGPSTRYAVYAKYYAQIKIQIENFGNANLPRYGDDRLYGDVIISLVVNAEGKIVDMSVIRSSGNVLLDSRAQAIIQAAAPYNPFIGELKQQYDELFLVLGMNFSKTSGVDVNLVEHQVK